MLPSLLGKTRLIKQLYRILGLAIVLGSFSAFIWVLWAAIGSAKGLEPDRWIPIVGAAALHFFMLFFLMLLWDRVLTLCRTSSDGSSSTITSKSSLYTAYSRSWLARYIPGRIWSMAGRTILVGRLGIPANQIARSIIIEVVLAYGMLTIISITVLSWVYLHPIIAFIILTTGVFLFGASLIKIGSLSTDVGIQTLKLPLAQMVTRRFARLLYGESSFSHTTVLKGLGFYGSYALMQLVFIVLIAASFSDLTVSKMAVIAGAWGISLTVGWLSIFPPVGLGARDGLAFVLFSQVIDLPAASSIVVASRLVMLSTDLAFVIAVESISKINIKSALFKNRFSKVNQLKT